MENRRLIISKRAANKLLNASEWYILNCGYSFASTLQKNVADDIEHLRKSPTIGKVTKDGKRRAYVSHKKCIIIYVYTANTLHVKDLVFTDTHKVRLF